MLLKYQFLSMKYMMFGMNPILIQFLRGKSCKYLSILFKYDDRSLGVSRKFSENFKENFTNYKRKHNAGLKLWNEVNTKTLGNFFVDKKQEPWYN